MSVRFVLSGAALLALTACGGGGGDSAPGLGSGEASFATMLSEVDRLQSYLESDPTTALPTNDTARYTGLIVIAQDLSLPGVSTQGYVGEVAIDVDFGATSGAITSGEALNFYAAGLDSVGDPATPIENLDETSALTISAPGDINDVTFSLDVNGQLDGSLVDGEMNAAFATDSARAIIAEEDGENFLVGVDSWDARMIADDRSR